MSRAAVSMSPFRFRSTAPNSPWPVRSTTASFPLSSHPLFHGWSWICGMRSLRMAVSSLQRYAWFFFWQTALRHGRSQRYCNMRGVNPLATYCLYGCGNPNEMPLPSDIRVDNCSVARSTALASAKLALELPQSIDRASSDAISRRLLHLPQWPKNRHLPPCLQNNFLGESPSLHSKIIAWKG